MRLRLAEIATGLDSPVALAVHPTDGGLFVAEQSGAVREIVDGTPSEVPALDLADEVSTGFEQGLLGITFSPTGDHLYANFTDGAGNTHVVEWEFDAAGAAIPESRRELLFVEQPFPNHNGGDVRVGPDGLLYVSLGDGGAGGDPLGSGQDRTTLLGSILRIDPTAPGDEAYTIPDDNPFVDDPAARGEIWQWGLRNPWRFSFDRETNDLWIGDVGQNAYEEIDFAVAGAAGINWGWNHREGFEDFAGGGPPGMVDPIHTYGRDEGISVTGGFVYRGAAIPALRGAYVYADFGEGDLIAISQADFVAVDVRPLDVNGGMVSSFGEDLDGELYVLDLGGTVRRIEPA